MHVSPGTRFFPKAAPHNLLVARQRHKTYYGYSILDKMPLTEEVEWKVVTKSDKKRVMRQRGRRSDLSRKAQVHSSVGQSSTSVENADVLCKALAECQTVVRNTDLFRKIQNAVLDASAASQEGEPSVSAIRQIVCYGVGNFSQTSLSYYSSSIWQLACVLCLQRELKVRDKDLIFYDPCSTPFEETFLENRFQVKVLTANENGNRPTNALPTLFFMPHCPSTLYENVLWSNWGESSLVFLGNSLRNHCESLNVKAADCPCMKTLLPWLREDRVDTSGPKKKLKSLPGNFEGAFNDTYVSYLALSEHGIDWPKRPYEAIRVETPEYSTNI